MRYGLKSLSIESMLNWSTATASAVGAFLGPIIDASYGSGRRVIFVALILSIVMDWIAGIGASLKDRTYSSEYGLAGIFHTLFVMAFPALANLLDQVMHTQGAIFYSITLGILYHTLNSMTANAVRAGWERWIPNKIIQMVSSEIQAKSERATKKKGSV